MGFFSMDGAFYRIGSIVGDILIIGILWILLAIPVFTIGAATTAAYFVFTKRINGKDGYLWRDFWKSFRQNFLTATAVWLTLLAVYAVLSFNIINAGLMEGMTNVMLIAQFVILTQVTFVTMYAFPLISRFEMGYLTVFKTAFFLANRHILFTISNAVLLASTIVIAFLQPVFVFACAGVYLYFSSFLIIKAFKKYRPDLDPEMVMGQMAPLNLEEESEEAEEADKPVAYDNNSTVLDLKRLQGLKDEER